MLPALLADASDILHSGTPRKIMHVPISHAILQCSATPSASMHPRPNSSFLSMVASRHCLGALSEGIGGGNRKTVSSLQKGEGVVHGRLLEATPCFCNVPLLLCGTTIYGSLENGVLFLISSKPFIACFPYLSPLSALFPWAQLCLSLMSRPTFFFFLGVVNFLPFCFFPSLSLFHAHFVLSTSWLHIFVPLIFFSLLLSALLYISSFYSYLLSH